MASTFIETHAFLCEKQAEILLEDLAQRGIYLIHPKSLLELLTTFLPLLSTRSSGDHGQSQSPANPVGSESRPSLFILLRLNNLT